MTEVIVIIHLNSQPIIPAAGFPIGGFFCTKTGSPVGNSPFVLLEVWLFYWVNLNRETIS